MFSSLKKILGTETDPFSLTIKEAIELVVDESIHNIRFVHGYRKKLREPVETAVNYCTDLARNIPGALDLDDEDPAVSAIIGGFFTDSEQARKVVSESPEVKRFLKEKSVNEIYALVTMKRRTKTVYDSGIQGQIVIRDIATKAYLFEDHKFILPSETIEEAFHAIRLGLLKILSHQALEQSLDLQRRKLELEHLREELDVKVRLMREERQQMTIEGNGSQGENVYIESQHLLHEVEQELAKVHSQSDHQEDYLNRVIDILSHPSRYLSLNLIPMRINRLGLFVKDDADSATDSFRIAEFTSGDAESRSAVLIKCHRDQLATDG